MYLYDRDTNKDRILKVMRKFNRNNIFPPEEEKMGFIHRELYVEEKSIIPTVIPEGFDKILKIKNLTLNAFISFDGFNYPVDYGDLIKIEITTEENDLTCFNF